MSFDYFYPLVENPKETLPTQWSKSVDVNRLTFSHKSRRVLTVTTDEKPTSYSKCKPILAVANRRVAITTGIYYFEVDIISKHPAGTLEIGFMSQSVPKNVSFYLYKESGFVNKVLHNRRHEVLFEPSFKAGDIIGCGVNFITRKCFFTKNGIFLDYAFLNMPANLIPCMSFKGSNFEAEANFGEAPFLFDFKNILEAASVGLSTRIRSLPFVLSTILDKNITTINELKQSDFVENVYFDSNIVRQKLVNLSFKDILRFIADVLPDFFNEHLDLYLAIKYYHTLATVNIILRGGKLYTNHSTYLQDLPLSEEMSAIFTGYPAANNLEANLLCNICSTISGSFTNMTLDDALFMLPLKKKIDFKYQFSRETNPSFEDLSKMNIKLLTTNNGKLQWFISETLGEYLFLEESFGPLSGDFQEPKCISHQQSHQGNDENLYRLWEENTVNHPLKKGFAKLSNSPLFSEPEKEEKPHTYAKMLKVEEPDTSAKDNLHFKCKLSIGDFYQFWFYGTGIFRYVDLRQLFVNYRIQMPLWRYMNMKPQPLENVFNSITSHEKVRKNPNEEIHFSDYSNNGGLQSQSQSIEPNENLIPLCDALLQPRTQKYFAKPHFDKIELENNEASDVPGLLPIDPQKISSDHSLLMDEACGVSKPLSVDIPKDDILPNEVNLNQSVTYYSPMNSSYNELESLENIPEAPHLEELYTTLDVHEFECQPYFDNENDCPESACCNLEDSPEILQKFGSTNNEECESLELMSPQESSGSAVDKEYQFNETISPLENFGSTEDVNCEFEEPVSPQESLGSTYDDADGFYEISALEKVEQSPIQPEVNKLQKIQANTVLDNENLNVEQNRAHSNFSKQNSAQPINTTRCIHDAAPTDYVQPISFAELIDFSISSPNYVQERKVQRPLHRSVNMSKPLEKEASLNASAQVVEPIPGNCQDIQLRCGQPEAMTIPMENEILPLLEAQSPIQSSTFLITPELPFFDPTVPPPGYPKKEFIPTTSQGKPTVYYEGNNFDAPSENIPEFFQRFSDMPAPISPNKSTSKFNSLDILHSMNHFTRKVSPHPVESLFTKQVIRKCTLPNIAKSNIKEEASGSRKTLPEHLVKELLEVNIGKIFTKLESKNLVERFTDYSGDVLALLFQTSIPKDWMTSLMNCVNKERLLDIICPLMKAYVQKNKICLPVQQIQEWEAESKSTNHLDVPFEFVFYPEEQKEEPGHI